MKDKAIDASSKISPPWVQTDPYWLPPSQVNEFFDVPFSFLEFNISLLINLMESV